MKTRSKCRRRSVSTQKRKTITPGLMLVAFMKLCLVLVAFDAMIGVASAAPYDITMRYFIGTDNDIKHWESATASSPYYTGTGTNAKSQNGSIDEAWGYWQADEVPVTLLPGLAGDVSGNVVSFFANVAKPEFHNLSGNIAGDDTMLEDANVPSGDFVAGWWIREAILNNDAQGAMIFDWSGNDGGSGAYTTGSTITLTATYDNVDYEWGVAVEGFAPDKEVKMAVSLWDNFDGAGEDVVNNNYIDDIERGSNSRIALFVGEIDYDHADGFGRRLDSTRRKSGDRLDFLPGQDNIDTERKDDQHKGQDFVLGIGWREDRWAQGIGATETLFAGNIELQAHIDAETGDINIVASTLSDLNSNGFVDFEDLTILLANWNKDVTAAEGNLVEPLVTVVNFADLTVLLADWTGPGPAGSPEAALGTEAVPEPSTLLLALLATLGLSFYRRRRRRTF